jgi:hypothetical protein
VGSTEGRRRGRHRHHPGGGDGTGERLPAGTAPDTVAGGRPGRPAHPGVAVRAGDRLHGRSHGGRGAHEYTRGSPENCPVFGRSRAGAAHPVSTTPYFIPDGSRSALRQFASAAGPTAGRLGDPPACDTNPAFHPSRMWPTSGWFGWRRCRHRPPSQMCWNNRVLSKPPAENDGWFGPASDHPDSLPTTARSSFKPPAIQRARSLASPHPAGDNPPAPTADTYCRCWLYPLRM